MGMSKQTTKALISNSKNTKKKCVSLKDINAKTNKTT